MTKDAQSIARAVTSVLHWCTLPAPGAHEAHTSTALAPRRARATNWAGNRTS